MVLSWLPVVGNPGSKFGGAYDVIVYGGELVGDGSSPVVDPVLDATVNASHQDSGIHDRMRFRILRNSSSVS